MQDADAATATVDERMPGGSLLQLDPRDDPDAYLAAIRHYIRGDTGVALAPLQAVITADECEARLAECDRLFAPWLVAQGRSAAEVAGVSAPRIAAALNHMHHESRCLTMSHDVLLDNTVELVRDVIARKVPGDLIETGVWRGGMTILMRAALEAYGGAQDGMRSVWVADSFAGLPTADPSVDLRDAIWNHMMRAVDSLASDLQSVRGAFAKAGLLDARVRFLPGWFSDTLADAPVEKLALMRLDGDWYESTRDALEALYPRLSSGGYVIIDDYGLPTGCARAVDEYRLAHGIDVPLVRVNVQAVYWQKA